jgi:hypothetical protein
LSDLTDAGKKIPVHHHKMYWPSLKTIANQGMLLYSGDYVVLVNPVFGDFMIPTDWDLLNTSFSDPTPQAAVNRLVEGIQTTDYVGDITVIALQISA